MGLSFQVDVASCAPVVGTGGETILDCGLCRGFLDGKERALYFQTRQGLLPLILCIRATYASRKRLHDPMQASGSLQPETALAQPTSRLTQTPCFTRRCGGCPSQTGLVDGKVVHRQSCRALACPDCKAKAICCWE